VPPQPPREVHDVLSECLERWEQGRGGVEELLAQYPELREQLEPLLQLAIELWALPPVRAPERLRRDPLWRRALTPPAAAPAREPASLPLWAAARRQRAGRRVIPLAPPWRAPARRLGRLAAGVAAAALGLLVMGTVVTSANSLPDEPLYPVKRLVEDAQLAMTPPDSRIEVHLRRAQERMKETREMVERDRADVVASLAEAYVREVDAVRQELQGSRGRALEPEQVGRVITRLEANEQMLGAIVERVPEPARPAILRAAEASRPETVAPDEVRVEIRRERLAPAPGLAPTFGPLGTAALVERPALPEFAEAATAPAPTSTPVRVQAPVSAATLLPTTVGVGPATGSITPRGGEPAAATPTPTPPPSAPAFTAPAPSPTPAAPAAVPTPGYQLLPPVGSSPTPSPSRTPSASPAREGLPTSPPATPTAAPTRQAP